MDAQPKFECLLTLQECLLVGTRWSHWKHGDVYIVVAVALVEGRRGVDGAHEREVIYRREGPDNEVWSRPWADFFSFVWRDRRDGWVPRFTPVTP